MRKYQMLAMLVSMFLSTNAYSLFGPKINHENCNISINTELPPTSLEELQLNLHNKGFYVVDKSDVEENVINALSLNLTIEQDSKYSTRKKRHVNTHVIHVSERSDFKNRFRSGVRVRQSSRRHVNARYGYIYMETISYSKQRYKTASLCKARSVYKNKSVAVVKILEKEIKLKNKNSSCRRNMLEVVKKVKLPKCRI